MSIHNQLNDEKTHGRDPSARKKSTCFSEVSLLSRSCMLIVLVFVQSYSFAEDLIHSNAAKFKIPFQFDQNELKKIGASEIQLYASENQGASWHLHESVKPSVSGFTYASEADGEYWFSVRTKTSSGLTYPAGPHQAGLKVIVDTTNPQLKLDVTEIAPGEVELEWNVSDEHLQLDSLKLESLDPDLNLWRSVEFSSAHNGRTSWKVAKAGLVEVRGSIQDEAGNSTELATQTIVAGDFPIGTRGESRSRPVASDLNSKAQMLSNQPIDVGADDLPGQPKSILTSNQSGEKTVAPQHLGKAPASPERPLDQLILPQLEDVIRDVTLPERKVPHVISPLKKLTPPDAPMKKLIPQEHKLQRMEPESTSEMQLKPIRPADPLQSMESVLEQPKPTRNRIGHLVNSNTFRIAYELEGVGPSGVSRIELFITENSGASWFHYGSDNDRTSPIVAKVPRDGDYGFSFRIRNGVGLVATPPQPGDRPEILVTVDQSAPVAELFPVKQGQGLTQNQLLITWSAKDRELDENPIALYYATQATGPWELIKGWAANTGHLQWTIPSVVEKNFYIRLDVRDAAGNITRIDGETPYTVDLSRPKARITDVESLKVGTSR